MTTQYSTYSWQTALKALALLTLLAALAACSSTDPKACSKLADRICEGAKAEVCTEVRSGWLDQRIAVTGTEARAERCSEILSDDKTVQAYRASALSELESKGEPAKQVAEAPRQKSQPASKTEKKKDKIDTPGEVLDFVGDTAEKAGENAEKVDKAGEKIDKLFD